MLTSLSLLFGMTKIHNSTFYVSGLMVTSERNLFYNIIQYTKLFSVHILTDYPLARYKWQIGSNVHSM